MKKFAFVLVASCSLCVMGLTGCGGGGETKVIEAPAATDEAAMPGMSDDAYNEAMQKQMSEQQQQGN